MPVLKLPEDDYDRELEFELEYQASLSAKEPFEIIKRK